MIASSSVMSARSKWVTCGTSVAESVMRSAMVRRRWESGCRSTGPHCSKRGSGGGSRPMAASGLAGPPGAGSRVAAGLRPRGARGGRRAGPGRGADVGIEHAAARPAAADRAEVHAQLAGEPAGGRRRGHRAAGGRAPRAGGGAVGAVGAGAVLGGAAVAVARGAVVGERDEHGADLHGLPRRHVDLLDPAADGRGDLDLRLVGLDLEQRGVLADDLALADQHRDDLGLGEAFSQVREGKLARHRRKARTRASRGRPRARGARRGRWRAPGRSPRRARRARSRGGPAPRARGTPPP